MRCGGEGREVNQGKERVKGIQPLHRIRANDINCMCFLITGAK